MPLLGSFIYAGTEDIAGGLHCIAHGIVAPGAPDVAMATWRTHVVSSTVATPSIPLCIVSLDSSVLILQNSNSSGGGPAQRRAYVCIAFFHGIVR